LAGTSAIEAGPRIACALVPPNPKEFTASSPRPPLPLLDGNGVSTVGILIPSSGS
jgi:hypothetical protein